MDVSVIIPTYKPKEYLWECLDSLLIQTFSKEKFEVILVLNGCDEPYKSAVEKYISTKMQGMNINFINTGQGGVSNARNLGMTVARGEYITFIDDDDYISPSYLQDLFNIANRDTISLCYPLSFKDGESIYKPFYITKDYISVKFNNSFPWYSARRFFNGPVYKLIHRDIIGDRRFDTRFTHGEDSLFMFSISDKFKQVAFTSKEAVYFRRERVGSAMRTKRSFFKKAVNEYNLFLARTSILIKSPRAYSLKFYFRSIVSSIVKLVIAD